MPIVSRLFAPSVRVAALNRAGVGAFDFFTGSAEVSQPFGTSANSEPNNRLTDQPNNGEE